MPVNLYKQKNPAYCNCYKNYHSMRDRNYFIGCLLQVITHTSLTQVCVYDTLRQSGFTSFTQNSHKLSEKECQSKKKTTQTASLRGFLAGAVRIELTTRGFGAIYYTKCNFMPHLVNGYIT